MARRRRPARPGGPRGKKKRRKPPRQQPTEPQIPDTQAARLEDETRRDVERLVKHRERGLGLTEDERLLDRVLTDHPEHAELFAKSGEWIVTGAGESPFLHVAFHRIVEQRIVTRELANLNTDLDWHDAVHEAIEFVEQEYLGPREGAHTGDAAEA